MATASPFDAALRDVVHRLHAATTALDRQPDRDRLAERAVELAVGLTRSTEGAIGLGAPETGFERVFSFGAPGMDSLTDEAALDLLERAGAKLATTVSRRRLKLGSTPAAVVGQELRAADLVTGFIAVGRSSGYSDIEREVIAVFAGHVAKALDGIWLRQRRNSLEAALLELRTRLDRLVERESAIAERLRTAERVERAHELAVQVLLAVSAHAFSGPSLSDFYGRLATTVGELVGAGKVLFWQLKDGNRLHPLPSAYGIDEPFLARLAPTRCDPDGDDLASRVVFKDLIFRANGNEEPGEFSYVLERLGVESAISVPWRAGTDRLGLLAAYDSTRPGGFSREDTWVLQKAGIAAGLVTQLWHAQEDLRKSVERLSKVDAARQLLLRNMSTVVEKERKRFVSELHDDALQKLTAAEMQVARLEPGHVVDESTVDAITDYLSQTEAALRRLVFEVHPPSLEARDGLAQSIQERLSMISAAGISHELTIEVPETIDRELKSMVFRQLSEAIGNVERHSKASVVKVSLTESEGGILGVVEDDGQGFVVSERSNVPGHLGLLALKERTLMAGGRYKIDSQPGAGTRIEFWVPLQA